MKIQKLTALALALALLFALAACGAPAAEAPAVTDAPVEATEVPAEPTEAPAAAAEEAAEAVTVRLAALTGPTAMGMAKIFSDADAGTAANSYEYALYGAADELTPQLLQGGVDIAAVPLNLASVLYNKTSGGVKLCAVGVLGVLYITEFNGETVQSLADLKGKTVHATGKGSTPEYFLRYLLAENGLDLDTDVTVEWKSEPSEVVALLKAENGGIAMLPQPYVTAAAAQLGEGFRAAVSLSEAWDALDNGSRCVTAGVVVRTEFAEAADAGEICGALNIVKPPIAAKAIPNCNLVCLTGEEMISAATGTLETLFALNPSAVGGALPGEDFWFGA